MQEMSSGNEVAEDKHSIGRKLYLECFNHHLDDDFDRSEAWKNFAEFHKKSFDEFWKKIREEGWMRNIDGEACCPKCWEKYLEKAGDYKDDVLEDSSSATKHAKSFHYATDEGWHIHCDREQEDGKPCASKIEESFDIDYQ